MTTRESAAFRPVRTATIGGRSSESASTDPIATLLAAGIATPREQDVLVRARRGMPLSPDDHATIRHLLTRLKMMVNGARSPGRMATPSTSTWSFEQAQRELKALKARHRPPPQTIGGQVVAPIATLKPPPATPIWSPSSRRS